MSVSHAPVVVHKSNADANEREHEVHAKQVALDELLTAMRETGAVHAAYRPRPRVSNPRYRARVRISNAEAERVPLPARNGGMGTFKVYVCGHGRYNASLIQTDTAMKSVWETSRALTPARILMLLVENVDSRDM